MLGQIIISHIADQGLMSKICKDLSKMQSNRKGQKSMRKHLTEVDTEMKDKDMQEYSNIINHQRNGS